MLVIENVKIVKLISNKYLLKTDTIANRHNEFYKQNKVKIAEYHNDYREQNKNKLIKTQKIL